MSILSISGAVLGILGLLLICFPKFVREINNSSRKVIFTDSELFSAPKLAGIFFILAGVILGWITKKLFYYEMHAHLEFFMNIDILGWILGVFAVISFFIGIMFIFRPLVLLRLFEIIHKVIFTDDFLWSSPKIFGIIFAGISIAIIYIGLKYKI